ncbi:MAG: hypothetical protein KDK66_07405 [Deltaproteobacteria bacterium]|nr:hypothetical protein [Deltaproteobacteria bacterium]
MKRLIILFALGALLAPVGDYFHLLSQTTQYPEGAYAFLFFDAIPWWVPLMFGSASLLMGLSIPASDVFLGKVTRPVDTKPLWAWAGVFNFLFFYIVSGYLPGQEGLGAVVILALAGLVLWWALDHTWQGFLLALVSAFLGTITEVTLVYLKVFSYLPPKNTLFGVAKWLPCLYFIAGVTVGNLGRLLRKN